jgi:hypothetical protein
LASALDGGEWSPSCNGHFTRRERTASTHCTEGWVNLGCRGCHTVEKFYLVPTGNRTIAVQSIALPVELSWIFPKIRTSINDQNNTGMCIATKIQFLEKRESLFLPLWFYGFWTE